MKKALRIVAVLVVLSLAVTYAVVASNFDKGVVYLTADQVSAMEFCNEGAYTFSNLINYQCRATQQCIYGGTTGTFCPNGADKEIRSVFMQNTDGTCTLHTFWGCSKCLVGENP